MPGILPMKVIRVGSSQQSRIAQACDRCRSKKIRCDGIRPCCTQCANVGFECKTSDKLSRRAFPRGYTESLEDRVRALEAEVREFKDLLDEKDEKLDMLSRIHNFSPQSRKPSLSPAGAAQVKDEPGSASEDSLHIETPVPAEPTSSLLGTSSTSAFIACFDTKAHEGGQQVPAIRPAAFLTQCRQSSSSGSPRKVSKIPPRLLSDQYINVFFQEWQPLLPVFHRPTFLRIYEQYILDPEADHWHTNKQAIAQLYLIFDVAAVSSISRIKQGPTSYEPQWRKALHSTPSVACVSSIQCHVLAQLYYLLKADYAHVAHHRAIAISMCHQLGLHQSQTSKSLAPLEMETHKRVFWCQYVLDKFTSAATGTPMLLHDADITTELPVDVDDENISAQGFSPSLPGELTKISSALALFRVTRILSRTLEQLYPAKSSYDVSLKTLHALSDELDQWSTNLPSHLRLQFCKDKPSTNLTGCRSPLLSLAYFYIRGLIHRPLVCHGPGGSTSSSTMVLASSAKHVLQILELLDERRMNYTFPLNKTELLLFAGFSLLWQCLELKDDSKLTKDNQKTLTTLVDILTHDSQTAGCEFLRVASCLVTIGSRRQGVNQPSKHTEISSEATRSLSSMPAPAEPKSKSTGKQLQAIASLFSTFSNKARPEDTSNRRRATIPREGPSESMSPPPHRAYSSVSLASIQSAPVLPLCTPFPSTSQPATQSRRIDLSQNVNLDYFPIGEEDNATHTSSSTTLPGKHVSANALGDASWEQLLTNLDSGTAGIYSGIYNTQTSVATQPLSGSQEWIVPPPLPEDDWSHLSTTDLSQSAKGTVPQSVLSFSEESLTSNDDLVFSAAGSHNGSTATNDSLDFGDALKRTSSAYKGITIPVDDGI